MKQDNNKLPQENIEVTPDREKFLLKRKKDVLQTLKLLSMEKVTITAFFGFGKYSMPTLLLGVLPEKNLLIMDYGPNEAVNKKFLEAERITFMSLYKGIKGQFSVLEATKSKYKGLPVFVVPIPETLLWLQRRQFYRIKTPLENPAYCQIAVNKEERIKVNILDISANGIAFIDVEGHFNEDTEEGNKIENCKLVLPGICKMTVNLEIRNRLLLNENDNDDSREQRIGCQFIEIGYTNEAKIQQYILSVERQRRHIS